MTTHPYCVTIPPCYTTIPPCSVTIQTCYITISPYYVIIPPCYVTISPYYVTTPPPSFFLHNHSSEDSRPWSLQYSPLHDNNSPLNDNYSPSCDIHASHMTTTLPPVMTIPAPHTWHSQSLSCHSWYSLASCDRCGPSRDIHNPSHDVHSPTHDVHVIPLCERLNVLSWDCECDEL